MQADSIRVPSAGTRLRLFVCTAIAIGVFHRLYGLGVHSIWLDESFTLFVAASDDFDASLRREINPPLSFYLFALAMDVLGPDEARLRLVPAVLSCLSLVLFADVALRLIDRARARIAAVLLYATAPFLVWYAQEIRMYAFLELGSLLLLWGAVRLGDRLRLACCAAFLGSFVAFGSHYFGAFSVLTALALASIAARARDVARRALLGFAGCASMGTAAWFPWLWRSLPEQLDSEWAPLAEPSSWQIVQTPFRILLVQMRLLPAILVYAACGLITIGLATALLSAWRARRRPSKEGIAISVAFAVPIVCVAAVSLLIEPRFVPRYLIASSAPLCLIVCAATVRVLPRAGSYLLSTLVLLFVFANTILHRENLKDGFRSACAELVVNYESDDRIAVCTGMPEGFAQAPLQFYLADKMPKPEILSIRNLSQFKEWLSTDSKGTRTHLIVRWMHYSQNLIKDVLSQAEVLAHGDVRQNVQWLLLEDAR